MKRLKLQKILKKYYSDSMVRSLLNGNRTPKLSEANMLQKKHRLSTLIWEDIKSYLQENNTPSQTKKVG